MQRSRAQYKRTNIEGNVRVLCDADISDTFVLVDDDMFLLEDIDEWPLWCRHQRLDEWVATFDDSRTIRGNFREALEYQLELLQAWGYDHPLSFNLHTPQRVDKTEMAKRLDDARIHNAARSVGRGRSLVNQDAEAPIPIDDVKLRKTTDLIDGAMVSLNRASWRYKAGRALRELFDEPAPWETSSRET